MTVGELSRRTGVPAKALREYADTGLVHTAGRSGANYRLFDTGALGCVRVVGQLRALGLTLAEIRHLARAYRGGDDQSIGPLIADQLRAARSRVNARIDELNQTLHRIDEFEAAGSSRLDLPPGGKP